MQTDMHSVIVTYPNDLALVWYPDTPNSVFEYRTFPNGKIEASPRCVHDVGFDVLFESVVLGIDTVYRNNVDEYGDEND